MRATPFLSKGDGPTPSTPLLGHGPDAQRSSSSDVTTIHMESKQPPTPGKLKRCGTLDSQETRVATAGTIWNAIFSADEAKVFQIIDREGVKSMKEYGSVGETPFLMCFLFGTDKHHEIAKKCVAIEPELIFAEYQATDANLYEGETALHLAVVHNNLEMIEFLLSTQATLHKQGKSSSKNLLNMGTKGTFFAPPVSLRNPSTMGPCYYGDVPLGFAACTANVSVLLLLLKWGADLYFIDRQHNTILHLLVLHDIPHMIELVCKLEEKENRKSTPLLETRNLDGLTPLMMAARLGRQASFDMILQIREKTMWTYGAIECNIAPLAGIDTIGEIGTESNDSAIAVIIACRTIELLMNKQILDVLDKKWSLYARRKYLVKCVRHTLLVATFSLACMLSDRNSGVYPFDEESVARSVTRIIAEGAALTLTLSKARVELMEIVSGGCRNYFNKHGFPRLENVLSSGYCLMIMLTVFTRIWSTAEGTELEAESLLTAVSIVLLYAYSFLLLLGFQLTGPFVIMIYQMFRGDLLRFCCVFLIINLGFSFLFLAIEENDSTVSSYDALWNRMRSLLLVVVGGLDSEDFHDGILHTWGGFFLVMSSAFLFLYIFLVTIMLLNLLIAMMGDTYSLVKEGAEKEYLMVKAQIIISIESEMSEAEFDTLEKKPYWVVIPDNDNKTNFRRYLQTQVKSEAFFESARDPTRLEKNNEMVTAYFAWRDHGKGVAGEGDGKMSEAESKALDAGSADLTRQLLESTETGKTGVTVSNYAQMRPLSVANLNAGDDGQ